uniref:Glyco_hydro_18 domain-containing protein n=1 Tax=Meloidogyne hapla TaxID=6305 RepID=A0A1I8BE46_MELHA
MKEASSVSHFLNELGVPYLVNNDREFIAFDNSRSIQIKTVWLSLQNIAGIALHGLEHDNIVGECPEGEPFLLLRTIAQSQTCYNCDITSEITNNKNTTVENQNNISSSMELIENSDEEETELNEEEKGLTPSKTSNEQTTLRCQHFNEYTSNFTVFCSFSLDNVEINLLLDCDTFMRPPLRRDFSQFLNELNSELFEKDNEKEVDKNVMDELMDCLPRLALKIQLSRKNISEVYEPEQLNKLLKFILLPSSIALSKAKAKVLNPLYASGIANQDDTDTQAREKNKIKLKKSGSVLTLENSKIKSSLIILELPTFAILQKREQENAEPTIVSQKEVCQFIRKPGVQHHTRFDAVTSYWKTSDEWLSGENEQTIKYKVQYALQRRLGGVLLKSLESDDPEDFCKNGGYGLLNTIHKARCGD